MTFLLEDFGAFLFWVWDGCKKDLKSYRTFPGDEWKKRRKNGLCGWIAGIIIGNLLLFLIDLLM